MSATSSDATVNQGDEGSPAGTAVRVAAAVAVFISGLIHLQLYLDGYRDIPDSQIGVAFLLNTIAAVIVAAALVLRRDLVLRAAAAALLAGTLLGFLLTHNGVRLLGFEGQGLEPSPQAALALVLEILGLVLLVATLLPAIGAGDDQPPAAAMAGAGVLVVLAIVGGLLWNREESVTTAPTTMVAETTAPPTTAAPTTVAPTTTAAVTPTSSANGSTTTGGDAASTTAAPTTALTTTTAPATTAGSGVMTVSIVDFAFDAPTLEIPVGTTVEWVNNDSFAHTVVANDQSFMSERLEAGDTFTFTFTTAGEFPYVCGIHPSMMGTIVVTG